MTNTGTLVVSTPTDREVVLTRVFDAPRHLVFDAMTQPELLKRWFGPRGWSLPVCEVDLRVSAWRFVLQGPDGSSPLNRAALSRLSAGYRDGYGSLPVVFRLTTSYFAGKDTLSASRIFR